jgi:hypothetical protein
MKGFSTVRIVVAGLLAGFFFAETIGDVSRDPTTIGGWIMSVVGCYFFGCSFFSPPRSC